MHIVTLQYPKFLQNPTSWLDAGVTLTNDMLSLDVTKCQTSVFSVASSALLTLDTSYLGSAHFSLNVIYFLHQASVVKMFFGFFLLVDPEPCSETQTTQGYFYESECGADPHRQLRNPTRNTRNFLCENVGLQST